jgi:hypothetical protein
MAWRKNDGAGSVRRLFFVILATPALDQIEGGDGFLPAQE